ncbi:MAG: prolyl oligopeptidase family serine peptidase, partial [Phaeodactylibacter sp.]|nr:prolyl oligopeptidase family serine peptidase [Phaeodactylibacter sp.]
ELIRRFSCELQVDKATPPAFLVHAQDDPVVPCTNSLLFYQGLLENQIPASLHIFPEGKHNIALRNNPGSTNLWTALCEAWLRQMGFL